MTSNLEARVQRLEDLEAIRRLKFQYCVYCDNNYDAAGIASLFVEDGVWDGGAAFGRHEGRTAIAAFFKEVGPTIPFAAHTVMNDKIDVNGNSAHGKWWCLMPYTLLDNGVGFDKWMFAEYTEEYVKVGGKWYFKTLNSAIYRDAPHLAGWIDKK